MGVAHHPDEWVVAQAFGEVSVGGVKEGRAKAHMSRKV